MAFGTSLFSVTLLFMISINVKCQYLATTPEPSTGCPEGYRPFGSKCYKIYSNYLEGVYKKSFDDAKSYCEDEKANLTSIHSKDEQDFLTAYLGEPDRTNVVWIGLKKKLHWSNREVTWVDGSQDQDFRNYAPGEPNGGEGELCFHLQDGDNIAGTWNDANCNTKKGFVCQTNRVGGGQDAPFQQDDECPEGFSRYRDRCFKLEKSEADFWTAESVCENDYGGHLATIEDNYDEAAVSLLTIDATTNVWIGFSDHLNDFMRGKFAWTDGSHVYHTNWDLGQPATTSGDRCVANTRVGWTVEDCGKKLAFVCVKHLKENTNSDEVHIGTCPDGWIDVHNRYCYYIEARLDRSYTSARSDCAKKAANGTLAMFESEHELRLLRPALANYPTKEFLIGIKQRDRGSSEWKFSNGKSADYLPWSDGEPNNLGREDCVEVNARSLKYNNYGCTDDRYYICQTNKVVHQTIKIVAENMAHRVGEDNGQEDKGLSQEAGTLIAVGVGLAALGLVLITYFVYQRRHNYEKPNSGIIRFRNEAD